MNILKKISKIRISLSEQDRKMPSAGLRRQIEEDPELYHHWKSEQELSEALRKEPVEEVAVPADLRAQILARVEQEEPAAKVIPFRTGWQLTAIAAVVAFGTVFVILQQDSSTLTEEYEAPVIQNIVEQPGAPITLETAVENHPLVQLSSVIESPLLEEPERLLNDAENALLYIGKNFLPSEQWRAEVKERYLGS